jgi:hypothetical protein
MAAEIISENQYRRSKLAASAAYQWRNGEMAEMAHRQCESVAASENIENVMALAACAAMRRK